MASCDLNLIRSGSVNVAAMPCKYAGFGSRLESPEINCKLYVRLGSSPAGRFPGDHTCGVPPVPIPNTVVKPARPMIVLRRESRLSPGSFKNRSSSSIGRVSGFFVLIFDAVATIASHSDPSMCYWICGEGNWVRCTADSVGLLGLHHLMPASVAGPACARVQRNSSGLSLKRTWSS